MDVYQLVDIILEGSCVDDVIVLNVIELKMNPI